MANTSPPTQNRADSTSKADGKRKKVEKITKNGIFDRSLGTAANLSKLLPTGTTLAFQTMAPSFTNRGECKDDHVNFAFTWGLISFHTFLCGLLAFNDSLTDKDGNTYYGLATPRGFKLFNQKLEDLHLFDDDNDAEKKTKLDKLKEGRKWRGRDFLHAIFSTAVFVALAFCDAGVQRCLVLHESRQWRGFLANFSPAVGFLASFVFMIFPSTRNGIGDDGAADVVVKPKTTEEPPKADGLKTSKSSLQTMADLTRVAPSTIYELEQMV